MMKNEINIGNYEAWLLDFGEGALGEDQKAMMLAFMGNHPELADDFDLVFEDMPYITF
jgi:hypothetical protein